MAKLGTFYALCPLIDTKNFFGVSEDPEKGVVIVTLGKNIASRYKISDQKQISCWRTKDKFSSPVIYDKLSSKYVSVFNKSFIRMWDQEESHLDKVKKYKFNKAIHTLISKNGQSYIVFGNGAMFKLEEALEQRKTLNPNIPDVEQIEDVLYKEMKNEIYFGVIVKTEETYIYWTKFDGSITKYSRIKLERSACTLAGYVFHVLENKMRLLTLWSDGAIYSFPLENVESDSDIEGELFSVVDSVSSKHPVSMASLGENHIALYGANHNEEGAVLVIYNTQFRVTQSKQPFKLFTRDAKVWRVENDILAPVGQNLAVVPFRLETQKLADLVGSQRVRSERRDSDVEFVSQVQALEFPKGKSIPPLLAARIDKMLKAGWPENSMLETMLPDLFAKHDTEMLGLILQHFTDISDRQLSKILKYLLSADRRCFKGAESLLENLPAALQPAERTRLIDVLLKRPFNLELIVPFLRLDISMDGVSALLKYIHLLLDASRVALADLKGPAAKKRLCQWLDLLMDSNFGQIMLNKDASLDNTFHALEKYFDDEAACDEPAKKLLAIMNDLLRKQSKTRIVRTSSPKLVREKLTLY